MGWGQSDSALYHHAGTLCGHLAEGNLYFWEALSAGCRYTIVFQGFINMGVSVGLLPVTGQNLPFFTTGGTSIWMTCIALGIVLSVSSKGVKSEE